MNWVRIFGAVMIVACSTLWGFYCSYRLKLRVRFLADFSEFLAALQTNIRYFGGDIFSLIKISAPSSIAFILGDERASFPDFWKNSIAKIPKSYSLKADDYSELFEFGNLLGTTDVEGQLSHIQIYKNTFEQILKDAQSESKTKSRLFKTLGFFAGAALALMII